MIKNILISFVVSTAVLAGFYYFMPYEIDSIITEETLGATITTIAGSDTLKNSRAVINTNFTNLNTDKIEVSTTTLPNITTLANLASIGTITSGTWNASTLTVAYGGTGSTTLLSNAVLLGNGTSGIKAVAAGSEGQVLKLSSGVPVWDDADVNESNNYDWTGIHSWTTGTTTFNSQATFADFACTDATATMATTTASGRFIQANEPYDDSHVANKSYVDGTLIGVIVSDTLRQSADTEQTCASVAVLEKSIRAPYSGTYRIKFDCKYQGTEGSSERIYKNGVAFGTDVACDSTSYETFSQDLNFVAGDTIELWCQSNDPGTGKVTYVDNLRVYYDIGVISPATFVPTVITD